MGVKGQITLARRASERERPIRAPPTLARRASERESPACGQGLKLTWSPAVQSKLLSLRGA